MVLLYIRSNKYYAWGRAVKPKNKPDRMENVKNVISIKYHQFKDGVTHFDDAECLYENLSDVPSGYDEKWGQRIDVEKWNDIVNEGYM